MQSLCNNNVLGIVVNAATCRGELVRQCYTYDHSYYTPKEPTNAPRLPAPECERQKV